jgi:hypothetical protein
VHSETPPFWKIDAKEGERDEDGVFHTIRGARACGHLDICMCMFIMSMFYAFAVLMNKYYLFAFELCTMIDNFLRFY